MDNQKAALIFVGMICVTILLVVAMLTGTIGGN